MKETRTKATSGFICFHFRNGKKFVKLQLLISIINYPFKKLSLFIFFLQGKPTLVKCIYVGIFRKADREQNWLEEGNYKDPTSAGVWDFQFLVLDFQHLQTDIAEEVEKIVDHEDVTGGKVGTLLA